MATRATILITENPIKGSEYKHTKTLLKNICKDGSVKMIYNHYNSGEILTETLKEIAKTKSFKYYSQAGSEQLQTDLIVQLIIKYNETKSIFDNLEINHHGVSTTTTYHADSEFIYWIDLYNMEIKKYATVWTFKPEWNIKSLNLMETIPLSKEVIPIYDFKV